MDEEQKPKRKTHTSSEVKMRYNKKTYSQINLLVRKEIAEEYRAKCKELGIPYSKPLHDAINEFIEEN